MEKKFIGNITDFLLNVDSVLVYKAVYDLHRFEWILERKDKMTFESFLYSSFIGKFNGKSHNNRTRFVQVLDAYYGEDHNQYYQFNGYLIGHLYENEAKEVSCTIDEQTVTLPCDRFGNIISCIKDMNKKTMIYIV